MLLDDNRTFLNPSSAAANRAGHEAASRASDAAAARIRRAGGDAAAAARAARAAFNTARPPINDFIQSYADRSDLAYINILERIPTDTTVAIYLARIKSYFQQAYDQYLGNAAIPNPRKFLETAITGDTYAIGLELRYLYGRLRGGTPNPRMAVSTVAISRVGSINISIAAYEFLNRIAALLTAFNPMYRPYHINILKLYKHYNAMGVAGGITQVMVGGVNYMNMSIFNGANPAAGPPSVINVNPGMALGSTGCPITPLDVLNNLMVLYYLLQKNVNEINVIIYNRAITFDIILADAERYIAANDGSLFPPPPGRPPGAPVPLPLSPPSPAPAPASVHTPYRPIIRPLSPVPAAAPAPRRGFLAALVGLVGCGHRRGAIRALLAPPSGTIHVMVHNPLAAPRVTARLMPGGRRTRKYRVARGGDPTRVNSDDYPILVNADNIVKSLLETSLVAFGTVVAALAVNSQDTMSSTIRAILDSQNIKINSNYTNSNNSTRNNNRNKKLNSNSVNLNRTPKNNRDSKMPNYSDLQIKSFFGQIVTSGAAGKINILYAYYIAFLPVEDQVEIMKLLMFIPLADPVIVANIMTYLSGQSQKDFMTYLESLKKIEIVKMRNVMDIDVEKAENDIHVMVNDYLKADGDDRYSMLLNAFNIS